MYTFEMRKPSEKSGTSKKDEKPVLKNIPKPIPKGENDGYTFIHGVNTFDDTSVPPEKN